jgi:hypothetical protein
MQTHETVTSLRKLSLRTNRKLGLASGVLFAIRGLWPLFYQGGSPKWGPIALFTAILAGALLRPYWLMPLKRGWFKSGLALNRITSPRYGILFFGAVVPRGSICAGKVRIFCVLKGIPKAGPSRSSVNRQVPRQTS